MSTSTSSELDFLDKSYDELVKKLGKERLLKVLDKMLGIRHLESRAEAAYLQGKIGGFFHSYIGQEAVQTAVLEVLGPEHWFATSYRCHALAYLLGVTPLEILAEFYGRSAGNAQGRGGSMHLYTERLMGGTGIVGGQVPLATGAAFALKYRGKQGEVAICFLGDGAVAQGAFHEAVNLAALWDLPCIYVIENNQWGMGTAVSRAISVDRIAESKAGGYGIKGYTLDGMDFFKCYAGFSHIYNEVITTSRPVLVEAVTERFKGHSISDPGLYRSKDELKACMKRDPILGLKEVMLKAKFLTEEEFKEREKRIRKEMADAMEQADAAPWPDPVVLEEGVLAD